MGGLRDARVGKTNWIPVTVRQPVLSVRVDMARFTPVASREPELRNSCRDTTTRPRNGAGTISDWYVLPRSVPIRMRHSRERLTSR